MVQLLIIATSFIVALSACASSQGFNRTAMNEALHVEPTPIPESQSIASQNVHLPTPFRLGVFFVNHDFPHRQSIRTVEWLARDRDQLLLGLAPLQDTHVLQDAFVLMDATLRGEDINGIRQAGARYGVDLVLVVDGLASVDRYNNRFAWLYPTLIAASWPRAPKATRSSWSLAACGLCAPNGTHRCRQLKEHRCWSDRRS